MVENARTLLNAQIEETTEAALNAEAAKAAAEENAAEAKDFAKNADKKAYKIVKKLDSLI